MKKYLLIGAVLCGSYAFSQMNYEKGYFINNKDERVECLIKDVGWKNNPTTFEYKLVENESAKVTSLKDVKSFEIYNQVKYIRADVLVDKSTGDLNRLSLKRESDFVPEQVFLKELAKGNVSLYGYSEDNLSRFFYRDSPGNYTQLIYKAYEIEPGKVAYNRDYKTQLKKILTCSSPSSDAVDNADYKEKKITALFTDYYRCIDPSYVSTKKQENKGTFNLNIRPRITSSSLEIQNTQTGTDYKFDNKIGFGIGLEVEYVLPFNKNKWSVIFEPTYRAYKGESSTEVNYAVGGVLKANVDYKSMELPLGIRHYMFLNNTSKLFINAQYVIDIPFNSTFEIKRSDGSMYNQLDIKSRPNLALGFGYNYNNKYAVEVRFNTNRTITGDYAFWTSKYKEVALILSYNVF